MILNILIKSLSATVHGPDFNLCLMLLREPAAILADIDSDDDTFLQTMPFLQELHAFVRTCQFSKFWAAFHDGGDDAGRILRTNPAYFPAHKGLEERIRVEFAQAIAASFRNVKAAQLGRWLGLKDADVPAWVQAHGWTLADGTVTIPPNGDNDVKAGVVKEKVELSRESFLREQGELREQREHRAGGRARTVLREGAAGTRALAKPVRARPRACTRTEDRADNHRADQACFRRGVLECGPSGADGRDRGCIMHMACILSGGTWDRRWGEPRFQRFRAGSTEDAPAYAGVALAHSAMRMCLW